MALTTCKECGNTVAGSPNACPQCGVNRPGVSYEIERLHRELKVAEESEQQHVRAFQTFLSLDFVNRLFERGALKEHTRLANLYQDVALQLRAQISRLELTKRRLRDAEELHRQWLESQKEV
jgi:hypothetical protein